MTIVISFTQEDIKELMVDRTKESLKTEDVFNITSEIVIRDGVPLFDVKYETPLPF